MHADGTAMLDTCKMNPNLYVCATGNEDMGIPFVTQARPPDVNGLIRDAWDTVGCPRVLEDHHPSGLRNPVDPTADFHVQRVELIFSRLGFMYIESMMRMGVLALPRLVNPLNARAPLYDPTHDNKS
ncbi:hypothetical protein EDD17DRAFT_936711 [Pisolithus thermaeus]|nr:hypothetical protein EDD17DRAFT_936711 [Pisolithus thermaeus]